MGGNKGQSMDDRLESIPQLSLPRLITIQALFQFIISSSHKSFHLHNKKRKIKTLSMYV